LILPLYNATPRWAAPVEAPFSGALSIGRHPLSRSPAAFSALAPRGGLRTVVWMQVFCGVDGGGTRTRAAWSTRLGGCWATALRRLRTPRRSVSMEPSGGGGSSVTRLCALPLRDGISAAFFAGLACADGPRRLGGRGPPAHADRAPGLRNLSIGMGGDIQNALAGALGGEPASSHRRDSSAAYGRNEAGEARQAGGWGWFIDDRAPATGWATRPCAPRPAATTDAGACRASRSPCACVPAHQDDPRDAQHHLQPALLSRAGAELAPILFKAAAEGDAVAISILEEGFRESP
jgi:hypothetical protein